MAAWSRLNDQLAVMGLHQSMLPVDSA
ncbi:protein of unknown function [Cupriavidus neocaledonicus]|uniref:Uncharacterized protein n=1 Tax=Cupriavidus neocaledonicus TaxID=1040979 RepID=A0A375HC19_9BURK|nr:protein of unknown function [Cupriavidus neocaledonicus]